MIMLLFIFMYVTRKHAHTDMPTFSLTHMCIYKHTDYIYIYIALYE